MLAFNQFSRVGVVALVAGLAPLASAQIKDVEPYYAIVNSASATLRAGETNQFYTVGTANQGTILVVDGEGAAWSRVTYPAGSFAFVRADDATYDSAAKKITLSKASRLYAANPASGMNGSWKALLTTALPSGTSLNVLQVDEAKTSGVIAYRVPVPAEARAYMESQNLRRASAEEVSAFRSKGGTVADLPKGAAAPVSTAPVTAAPSTAQATAPQSQPAETKPAETKPTETKPVTAAPKVDNSLVAPMKTEGTAGTPTNTPTSAPTSAPVTIDQGAGATNPAMTSNPTPAPAAAAPVSTPAVAAPAEATPRPVSPAMRTAARIKELDAAFTRVNAQPLGEAEYESLIAEYERSIEELSGDLSPRQKAVLMARLDILKFRKELREKQQALLNDSSSTQQQNLQVLQRVTQVESTRVYTMVGQLQPSTVYNGQTLPLMYRIQSVGTSVPRTLGYIKPDPKFALESKLGMLVGVIGETTIDKELRLNVIDAVRVDLLQNVPVQPTLQPAVTIPTAPTAPVPMPEQPAPKKSTIEVTK
ncbi:MAG: hypothetical protein K2Y21_02840 [Phycisphaerales bacterium]|nr:hypothetical protein [Phycisphaerales bacterium]